MTVDPERDDAARLKAYLAAFDPSFVGATGTPDAAGGGAQELRRRRPKQVRCDGGYVMDHSSSIYLIDRDRQAARA